MNALLRQSDFIDSSGFIPHKLTVDDAIKLESAGMFGGARTEIIDGVVYYMPADGSVHKNWSAGLGRWLFNTLGPEYVIMPSTTLVLGPHDGPSPDWHIFSSTLDTEDVRGPDVLLTIEQSNTSLKRDLSMKAELYAREDVREYWVIDIQQRLLHRHREPSPEGYRDLPPPFSATDTVEALLIPGLKLRMADLPRVGSAS